MTLLRIHPFRCFRAPLRIPCVWMQFLFLLIAVISVTCADPIYVDDRDPAIVYTGNWTAQTDRDGLFDRGDTWSETPGDTVSYTFFGSAIEYWGTQGPRNGRCSVTIDGVDHGKIVAYNTSYTTPAIMLFRYTQDVAHTLASPDTPATNHTIVIGVTTDQDQPNGARCEVDYFVYLPPLSSNDSSSGSFTTPQNSSSFDPTDRVQSIVLPAVLVPAILGFLAWGIWWWYKHQRSEMRREILDLRQAISLLRNPPRNRNVPPADVETPSAPRRGPSDREAPAPVADSEMGGLNMAGIGARPVSLPARLGGGAGPSQIRRSSTAPIRHGRGGARPLGARPVPSRPSPLSSSITSSTALGSAGRRTPVVPPSRRRTEPTMDTVTEDGVLGGEDPPNLIRSSTVRNDPDSPNPRRARVDDDDDSDT